MAWKIGLLIIFCDSFEVSTFLLTGGDRQNYSFSISKVHFWTSSPFFLVMYCITVGNLKVSSVFGFLYPETAVSFSVFKKKKYIYIIFVCLKIAVLVFGFGLEAKTGCLCLLLRSITTSYYVETPSYQKSFKKIV